MLSIGERIRDYEVVAHLKSGGMASLFLGRRVGAAGFARPVAVKVIHSELSEDPHFVQMFVDEALIAARISHPNVVHVEELGEHGGHYFLVMEYVHGCSLAQLVRALIRRGRGLTPAVATHIAIQVAEGLHAAHETVGDDGNKLGVVHRDVSPQNVLLSYGGHVKLIDFGVAKARGRAVQTTGSSLKGKLRYMSPEQASGEDVDARTDVYALGVVLWEMLTMRRLFQGEGELEVLAKVREPDVPRPSEYADVPRALEAVVLRALAKRPADRPATAAELRRLLAQAVPEALAVESRELGELLRAVMSEQIEQQHEKLPESVSRVFRTEAAAPSEQDVSVALQTLTTSAPGDALVDRTADTNASPARSGARATKRTRPRFLWAAAIGAGIAAGALVAILIAAGDGGNATVPPSGQAPLVDPAPSAAPAEELEPDAGITPATERATTAASEPARTTTKRPRRRTRPRAPADDPATESPRIRHGVPLADDFDL